MFGAFIFAKLKLLPSFTVYVDLVAHVGDCCYVAHVGDCYYFFNDTFFAKKELIRPYVLLSFYCCSIRCYIVNL